MSGDRSPHVCPVGVMSAVTFKTYACNRQIDQIPQNEHFTPAVRYGCQTMRGGQGRRQKGRQRRGGRRQPAKKSCPHSVQGFLHRKLKLETVFTPCRGHRVTQPPPRACDVSVRCIIYDHQRNVQEVSPHPRKMIFVMGPV